MKIKENLLFITNSKDSSYPVTDTADWVITVDICALFVPVEEKITGFESQYKYQHCDPGIIQPVRPKCNKISVLNFTDSYNPSIPRSHFTNISYLHFKNV